MSGHTLGERELTRLSYLTASICSAPDMWPRFMMIVTGAVRRDVLGRIMRNDEGSAEFQGAINAMWDALATSLTLSQAATKLLRQDGGARDAGSCLLAALETYGRGGDIALPRRVR